MAVRRPRIKPIANIGCAKRKTSVSNNNPKLNNNSENVIKKEEISIKNENLYSEINLPDEINTSCKNNSSDLTITKIANDKPRQRIRPTPCFDLRRNSVTSNSNSLPQTSTQITNTDLVPNFTENIDKSLENYQQKQIQTGNRTPNTSRTHKISESSNGGFLSPNRVQNYQPNASPNYNNSQQHGNTTQHEENSLSLPPTKQHIPPRYRKISSMEDTPKLLSARREFNTKYNVKKPEKSTLKLCDYIFYNPPSNPMIFETKQENLVSEETEIDNKENSKGIQDNEESKVKESEEEHAPVPQLKLGPNGEIILDEKSLVIETTAEKHARSALASSKSAIYLDEYSGNNGFYSRQKRTKDWTPEETIKFYRCLHTIGTDFSMMSSLFPNRSRRDLKLKFKKEERNNSVLINKALLKPNTFDIEALKDELLREEKLAEEKRKEEFDRKLKIQKKIENKILNSVKNDETDDKSTNDNEIKSFYSRTKNAMSKGDLAYEMQDTLIAKKRKNNFKKEKEPKNEYSNQSNESISVTEMDVDDIVSVNSVNEFGYDESSGIEITDIGDILTLEDTMPQFKNSTLAIVSKYDKNNPENVKHGIYIICRSTGIMSQKPLDLPEETINCILKAMGKI